MRKISGFGLVALLAGLSLAPAPQAGVEDEQGARKLTDAYSAAFNKGDLEGVMAHWASDADYVDDAGKAYKGKAAIAALFKQQLTNLKGYKLSIQVKTQRLVSAEVALVDGTVDVTSPDGVTESSSYSAVLVKSSGKWLLSRVRDLPQAGEARPGAGHLKQLDWMIGDWVYDGKLGEVHASARWIMNKNFIHQEYEVKAKGSEGITVSQWIGWDPATGRIKSWFIDSHGGHGEGLWSRQGNTWTIDAAGVLPDGRQGTATHTLKKLDDKTSVWQSHNRQVDGQPQPDVDIKFTRK